MAQAVAELRILTNYFRREVRRGSITLEVYCTILDFCVLDLGTIGLKIAVFRS